MVDQIGKPVSITVEDWGSVLEEIKNTLEVMEVRQRDQTADQKRLDDLIIQLPDGLRADFEKLIKEAAATQLSLLPSEN